MSDTSNAYFPMSEGWIRVNRASERPADLLFGLSGFVAYRRGVDGKLEIGCVNGLTKACTAVAVTERQLAGAISWAAGEGSIQKLMPYDSSDLRELIISGIAPGEFPGDEE